MIHASETLRRTRRNSSIAGAAGFGSGALLPSASATERHHARPLAIHALQSKPGWGRENEVIPHLAVAVGQSRGTGWLRAESKGWIRDRSSGC